MKFCSLVLELHLPQNFCHRHTERQTDRHFPKIVKSCSGHPKACKSIKNRKSKICTKQILSSTYIEESNKLTNLIWYQYDFTRIYSSQHSLRGLCANTFTLSCVIFWKSVHVKFFCLLEDRNISLFCELNNIHNYKINSFTAMAFLFSSPLNEFAIKVNPRKTSMLWPSQKFLLHKCCTFI